MLVHISVLVRVGGMLSAVGDSDHYGLQYHFQGSAANDHSREGRNGGFCPHLFGRWVHPRHRKNYYEAHSISTYHSYYTK